MQINFTNYGVIGLSLNQILNKNIMDIFEYQNKEREKTHAPLANRMRPKKLDDYIGQEHILGPNKLLRRAIELDRFFSSIILWGPPGTGKTTLAMIIANTTKSNFETISAVTAGIAEIRQLIVNAKQNSLYGKKTIVLVDEIHRFNKAQQDALLPHVENGTITLIGATTENPYFEVIPALVSRSRVFSLKQLTTQQLSKLLLKAIEDKERGYGNKNIKMSQEAFDHLAAISNGDARSALNALELAVESTNPNSDGILEIDLLTAEEAIQKRALRYDRVGDEHYDTISAFIKSVRGSDPDAALYWLAKMIYAGEDPKFIMRRLLILASEDIGMADPLAIVIATSCARALEWCGLPEAQYHLAQATVYLATANKSNSLCCYFDALALVEKEGKTEVPNHLKDPARDGQHEGHGKGYKYPHDSPGHWVKQNYLPEKLHGQKFYNPSDQGHELKIRDRMKSKN